MANGNEASPLWYAVGGIVLVLAMITGVVLFRPLQYTTTPQTTCEGADCSHEGPPAASHEAPPPHE